MAASTQELVVDRRNTNIVRTIVAGVVGPLVVAIILGYVAIYSTITKLTILAEQADKRITAVEQDLRRHETEYRELQMLIVKQTQILDTLYKDLTQVKSDHRGGN